MYKLLDDCAMAGAVIQHTPSSGFHALFKFREDSDGWVTKTRCLEYKGIPLHVDVRTDGGYFITSPSAVVPK